MESMTFKIVGTSPIIMHNARLANVLDPIVKEMKSITSKGKKKTEDDIEQLAWLEFKGGLYWNEQHGPFLPAKNLEATIRDAAKLQRKGKDVQRGLMVLDDAPLEYKGPRDPEGLWKKRFYLICPVGVNGSLVMRTRPMFNEWGCNFKVMYNPELLNPQDIVEFVKVAGEVTGMCDYRPRHGRFDVKN